MTISKTFRFFPINTNTYWCDISIIIDIKLANNGEYYHIKYENCFSNKDTSNDTLDNSHPFYNTEFMEHCNGDVIIKNEMTDKMISFLMMNNDELVKYSGLSTPQRYKSNIMCSITYFWD